MFEVLYCIVFCFCSDNIFVFMMRKVEINDMY